MWWVGVGQRGETEGDLATDCTQQPGHMCTLQSSHDVQCLMYTVQGMMHSVQCKAFIAQLGAHHTLYCFTSVWQCVISVYSMGYEPLVTKV